MPKINLSPETQPSQSETYVTFLLDKSFSMMGVRQVTIDAFNAYLAKLKEQQGIIFSLLQFDSFDVEKIVSLRPIGEVQALTLATYAPRGGTPLIDAAYETILATAKAVAGKDVKVVVCIQTDGEENVSTKHTFASLNALIKDKMEQGWQFNFMGAGIDAYQQGARMGITVANTMSYDKDNVAATMRSFGASAVNTVMFAQGLRASTAYSGAQKMAAGDKFDPGLGGAPAVNRPKPTPRPPMAAAVAPRFVVEPIEL